MNKDHLFDIAHCLLALRNDKDMTGKQRDRIIDTIDSLITALFVNLLDHGTADEYKDEMIKILGWAKLEIKG